MTKDKIVDYGMVNKDERPLFGGPVLPRREDRKATKRYVTIGSSVLLLAAGAVLGYAALPSRRVATVDIANLESMPRMPMIDMPLPEEPPVVIDPSTPMPITDMPSPQEPPMSIIDMPSPQEPPMSIIDMPSPQEPPMSIVDMPSPQEPPMSIIDMPSPQEPPMSIIDMPSPQEPPMSIIDMPSPQEPPMSIVDMPSPQEPPRGIVVPVEAIAPIQHGVMPPVTELDLDMDGHVSAEEYLYRAIKRHDGIIKRVDASTMSAVAKDYIADRLRRHYAREAWCVSQIATRDIDRNGVMMTDFKVFYAAIQKTCDVYDMDIPPEYQPGEETLATSMPLEELTPAPTIDKLPIRPFKPAEIPEGHAIRCNWESPSTYRYMQSTRRLYPSDTIAASWDPYWSLALIADCSLLPEGPDMEFNGTPTLPPSKMPPRDLHEGQSFRCDWGSLDVFRFVGGNSCLYPTATIAASWDPYWDDAVVVDCEGLPRGENMKLYGTEPPTTQTPPSTKYPTALLVDGMPMKCDSSETLVSRYNGGSDYRQYASPTIAASWDPNWLDFVIVDCSMLTKGPDLVIVAPPVLPPRPKLTPAELPHRTTIRCEWDSDEVFFYTGYEMYHWYPTHAMAAQDDPNWMAAPAADCDMLVRGDNMPLPKIHEGVDPSELIEGQTVKCEETADMFYRYSSMMGGMLFYFPGPDVATSWDPFWRDAVHADCSSLHHGAEMVMKPMPTDAPTLPPSKFVNGLAIRCMSVSDDVYRVSEGGVIRRYPNMDIAESWDANWLGAAWYDCSGMEQGPDMEFNGTPPPPPTQPPPVRVPKELLVEGMAIKCEEHGKPYRFTNGTRRYYPTQEIALSWEPYAIALVLANCDDIPEGPEMTTKPPTILNGQSVQCNGSTYRYRYWNNTLFEYPDPAIALSWDATFDATTMTVDCASFPKGPAMTMRPLPPINLAEGQTIRCGSSVNDLYRYTSGARRWYPNYPVLASWDMNYKTAPFIDCSSLPVGSVMEVFQQPLYYGIAIRCNGNSSIFRYTNQTVRAYPSYEIMNSWDPQAMMAGSVNCSSFQFGPDMRMKPSPLTTLTDGDAVRCEHDMQGVYRYGGGEVRIYGSLEVAMSWGVNWNAAPVIDCGLLPIGLPMKFKMPPLYNGQTVKCSQNSTNYYRFDDGFLRSYPNERIAQSWDVDLTQVTVVFCPSFRLTSPMAFNVHKLEEGQPIKCNAHGQELYRYTSGQIRLYPSYDILMSWDTEAYQHAVEIECPLIFQGDNMDYRRPIVPDGRTVRCIGAGPFYLFMNGTLREFENLNDAASWDNNWANPMYIDCSGFEVGPIMKAKLPSPFGLAEGTSIKCAVDDDKVYRLTSGTRRLYPSDTIALSWDPFYYTHYVVVDCSSLPFGPNMQSNYPLKEGETVRCSNGPAVFRYTNKTIRLYPTDAIALSWDPNAMMATTMVDCAQYVHGPVMAARSAVYIPDGQAIKCFATDAVTYRYTCGSMRLYPNADIANSWDPTWHQPMVVNCMWIPLGRPMDMYTPPIVPTLQDGAVVTCNDGGFFENRRFRYCSDEIRDMGNDREARSWDRNYLGASTVIENCEALPRGPALNVRKPNLPEGQTVTCDDTDALYRFEAFTLRRYATHEIAASWDANWEFPVAIDCEFFDTAPEMPPRIQRFNATEGQSVVCEANRTDIYRYASGMLRLYPTPDIALSWNRDFMNTTLVNCSKYPLGPNMEYYEPPLFEGQAVKCDDGPGIYRYMNGALQVYPTVEVAASWDPVFYNATRIDCSRFRMNMPMKMKLPPPTGLPEGQAIRCENDAAVYRMTSGQYRRYPSPYIAASWDAHWQHAPVIDCSYLVEGPWMPYNQPVIYEGQAIKCDDGPAVYRYENNTIRGYPTEAVAWSWDWMWPHAIKVDCGNFTVGPHMNVRGRPVYGLPEGQAVRCSDTSAEVFRWTGGELRLYPNEGIAWSWDTNWTPAMLVDCANVPISDPMKYNNPILVDGQSIKCDDSSMTYRYVNNAIYWYPSGPIADTWDWMWRNAIVVDCSGFDRGEQLDYNLPEPFGLPEGMAIKCSPDSNETYRFTSYERRLYPNEYVAASWDGNWHAALPVSCKNLRRGDDMTARLPDIPDGRSVKCDTGPNIYRYSNGSIHFYPDAQVAAAWDPMFMYPIYIDCSQLARGLDVKSRTIDGWKLLDGSFAQLSFDGKRLCGVNSNGQAMCAVNNIRGEGATTWRYLPGVFKQIVVYGDKLYAIGYNDLLHVGSALNSDPAWVEVHVMFKHISTDGKQVCGVDYNHQVMCIYSDLLTQPRVEHFPGSWSQVEVVNGMLLGVQTNKMLHRGVPARGGMWNPLFDTMDQVSYDGARYCGVSNGEAKCATSFDGNDRLMWSTSIGNLRSVHVHAGDLFGLTDTGDVLYREIM